MQMVKSTRLDQVYKTLSGRPLAMEEMDEFYLNTEEARGDKRIRQRMARVLRNNEGEHLQFLLVGYKGCGKSTELNHLQRDIQDQFLVLNYSVQYELDPVHLNYIELFIVTMERLFNAARENNLPISEEYLKSIQTWVNSREIQEIKDKYIGNEKDETYSAAALEKFFHKFRLSAKSSFSLKEVLKRNVEPRLSDLIGHCNALIREIRIQLLKKGKKDLLIIVEDLDKIPLDRAQELFLNYTNQLTQLQANVIFTFPIALYHSRQFNEIKIYFNGGIFELPMIRVTDPDGLENQEGIKTLHDIVAQRMDIEGLFENPKLLKTIILYSGGVLRDLFLLIREATERALDFDRKKITQEDWLRSLQKMKKEYANNISDDTVGGSLKVDDYYAALVALIHNRSKQVDNSDVVMHLRQNLSILGYNGEGWCDVHPIIKDILRDRGKI